MTVKFRILFAILVGVLTLALIGLGLKIANEDNELITLRQKESRDAQLQLRSSEIELFLQKLRQQIEQVLPIAAPSVEDLRKITAQNPIIVQTFHLNNQGNLIYPQKQLFDLSNSEKEFLVRTSQIFSKGLTYLKTELPSDDSQTHPFHDGAWDSYFWSDGLHLVVYQTLANQDVMGAEISSIKMMSELISFLAEKSRSSAFEGEVILRRDSGEELFRWPGHGEQHKDARSNISLLPPLQSFQLLAYSPQKQVSHSTFFTTLTGIIFAVSTLFLTALFAVREYRRELREAGQQVRFVNQVSHELRTPLTNIRLYAELLEQNSDPEDSLSSRYARVIVKESERLSRLIGTILKFGESGRGTLSVRKYKGDLREVLHQIGEIHKPSCKALGMQIDIHIPESFPDLLLFDRDAVFQIISNLFSNSEKYARRGTIDLRATFVGETTTIEIKDEGPGIPAALHKKVFEPFFRISHDISEGVTGTGIGLGLARDLSRLHGGDLNIIPGATGLQIVVTLHTPHISKSDLT